MRPKHARPATKADETPPIGCIVHGCTKIVETRGYCCAHYHKLLRYGDPLWTRARGPSAFDILRPVIGDDLARAVISARSARGAKKNFDAYRANITLAMFKRASDPRLSAWEYVNRESNNRELTREYLRACVVYDAETGVFTARLPSSSRNEGDVLGSVGNHGYLSISVAQRSYLAHRLAWFYVNGEWPELIDHIDRDRRNNRLSNLRNCSFVENAWNVSPRPNLSGVTGVNWFAARGKWVAKISSGGRTKTLGYFDSIEAAARAREAAVEAARGHFLNQPHGGQNARLCIR